MSVRLVHFAQSTVAIEHCGAAAEALVEFLFAHLPAPAPAAPQAGFCLTETPANGLWQLVENDTLAQAAVPAGVVAEHLLGRTTYQIAWHSQGGLVFHAAAVGRQDQGLLLPGTMGAGKSTLTAWLLTRGFHYLTDELSFIPHQAMAVRGFARPLNLKHAARPALQSLVSDDRSAGRIVSGELSDLMAPEVFSPLPVLAEVPLRLVLFPRYQPGLPLTLTPLTPAQAGLALTGCLINARNLPEHGFPEIVRLARTVPAYRLDYGGFAQLPAALEALWGAEETLAPAAGATCLAEGQAPAGG